MAKSIMIQGTMSNAGKSLIAAGLCRVFHRAGYRVAPFKSQNMALNSFITNEGLEMGRAQVMQAEAAGIEPSVRMNPILLKPTNDTGSQVIVNGEVVGVMKAAEYYRRKKELVPEIRKAYRALEREYDIIVLEGAGSPAEINLQENDIVNMGMAKLAGSPVLLVGDIDRGGVFASLYGTLLLLEKEEREMVKGLIINKFRGDPSLLAPGLRQLEELAGVPVAGVIPYARLDLDDEDSLSERFRKKPSPGRLDIAVIRLPRISNFTDFSALEIQEDVSLRYVETAGALGEPDLVILPGTKNTMEDLLWLRQCGLEAEILQAASKGKPVLGICGGYQMMGEELCDPQKVEHGGSMRGMGLLPARTVFEPQKTRSRVEGSFLPADGLFSAMAGSDMEGYEIHMGQTQALRPARPLLSLRTMDGTAKVDGLSCGNCAGAYVHGIFDMEESAAALVNALLAEKGLEPSAKALNLRGYKERQYDLLADVLEQNLDMAFIYRILEQGLA